MAVKKKSLIAKTAEKKAKATKILRLHGTRGETLRILIRRLGSNTLSVQLE